MAATSAEQFFAVLEKSRLLAPTQLAQARSATAPGDDPMTIAKRLVRQDLITRWQAGQLLAGRSALGLGKYRLIELLGRGVKSSVFLAQHTTMNRRVALKIISREASRDPAALKRFLADARAIAALDHPNLVPAYSVDNEGDRYYLVTEYVEGVDLQRLVDEDGPLDWQRAVDYIRQAADGLDYAHQHHMVHHGIRPSKLLVNLQGVLKIIDLGLAWLGDGEWLTAVGQDARETDAVDYLAPEQTLEGAKPDARADIYSLGCVLHFVLVGHPSFRRGTPSQRMLAHQTRDLPDLQAEQPKVPPELAAICKRMVAREPADRYPTVGEASRALAQWQDGLAGR
jgi:eukaryotic-like serine/threonine-protein kinase